VTWQGRTVPSLVPAYSEDGGHLNVEGQGRAARALLEVLADLPERPGSGPVPR
jgi:lysophospholipase L1-like esterase